MLFLDNNLTDDVKHLFLADNDNSGHPQNGTSVASAARHTSHRTVCRVRSGGAAVAYGDVFSRGPLAGVCILCHCILGTTISGGTDRFVK